MCYIPRQGIDPQEFLSTMLDRTHAVYVWGREESYQNGKESLRFYLVFSKGVPSSRIIRASDSKAYCWSVNETSFLISPNYPIGDPLSPEYSFGSKSPSIGKRRRTRTIYLSYKETFFPSEYVFACLKQEKGLKALLVSSNEEDSEEKLSVFIHFGRDRDMNVRTLLGIHIPYSQIQEIDPYGYIDTKTLFPNG